MKKKENPKCIFYKSQSKYLLLGLILIALFFLIFFGVAAFAGGLNFYSFLFLGMKTHVLFTILGAFHVGILGIGILILIFAYFNITPKICCFDDRFEIIMFLQTKKVVYYNQIKDITYRIKYIGYESKNWFSSNKECRVYINNPTYYFYFYYPVKGYFDEVDILSKKDFDDMPRRCFAEKEMILKLLNEIKIIYGINLPHLP